MKASGNRKHRFGFAGIALGVLLAGILAGSAAGAPGDTVVTVSQVADINMGPGNSDPDRFAAIGSTAFFRANDGTANGNELWKSEPPYTSATMVENINTDAGGNGEPNFLTAVGDTLFFRASAGSGGTGTELYKSEPPYNAASTNLVADIIPGPETGSNPTELFNFNGTVFFSADGPTNGRELWKSGGGPLGTGPDDTQLVANINPGGDSSPQQLTEVNGTLFFGADDGTNGTELWKSNGGTAMGDTVIVKNINTTAMTGSDPDELTNVSGTLFFSADDGTNNGTELWASAPPNFNAATTNLVEDIFPGAGNSGNPGSLTAIGSTLFFEADDSSDSPFHGSELWKSVAPYTTAATDIVSDIRPGTASSDPGGLVDVNGVLLFRADEGMNGTELWRSDGSAPGTVIVANINTGNPAGTNPGASSTPADLTNVNGTLLFRANDGIAGAELWKSSGTAATTMRAGDIFTGGSSSNPSQLTNVNGTLLFQANEPVAGNELYKATLSTEPFPPTLTPTSPAITPTTPKKCKKGQKLRKGKCVKKKKRRK